MVFPTQSLVNIQNILQFICEVREVNNLTDDTFHVWLKECDPMFRSDQQFTYSSWFCSVVYLYRTQGVHVS